MFAIRMGALLILVVAVVLYFVPIYISQVRQHPNRQSIFWLNLFLGWTFLGWVAALIWSVSGSSAPREVVRPTVLEGKVLQSGDTKKN